MPIDSTPSVGALRSPGTLDARLLQKSAGQRPASASGSNAGSVIVSSESLDPGAVPVDVERVEQVRKAVESGAYPLLPAKIADAMIAAGILLRSPK